MPCRLERARGMSADRFEGHANCHCRSTFSGEREEVWPTHDTVPARPPKRASRSAPEPRYLPSFGTRRPPMFRQPTQAMAQPIPRHAAEPTAPLAADDKWQAIKLRQKARRIRNRSAKRTSRRTLRAQARVSRRARLPEYEDLGRDHRLLPRLPQPSFSRRLDPIQPPLRTSARPPRRLDMLQHRHRT